MVIISNYYLKVNKKSVELGHQNKDLDNKHNRNLQRIEKLEENTGSRDMLHSGGNTGASAIFALP